MKQYGWINASIVLKTALHVGAGKNDLPTDSLLRRTASGNIVIPGRALGGSLRTTAERLAPRMTDNQGHNWTACKHLLETTGKEDPCGCLVCRLFGERYPNEKRTGGRASKLWFHDALLAAGPAGQDAVASHIRDGVGIDRTYGAAARNIKFDYEVLAAGSTFPFHLEWREELGQEEEELLAAALGEWIEGRGQLGGRSARGLGAFVLESLSGCTLQLDSTAALMAYLRRTPGKDEIPSAGDGWFHRSLERAASSARRSSLLDDALRPAAAGGFVEVRFRLVFQGPALINDPLMAGRTDFDHAPLVAYLWPGRDEIETPILSGASLRGALRSRAEKIARTLAAGKFSAAAEYLDHCPVCNPLHNPRKGVEDINGQNPFLSCDARLKTPNTKETREEDLCLACRLFGSQRRGSRLLVRDAAWVAQAGRSWSARDFLAIDRFTGGGQDGAKFDAAGLDTPAFDAALLLHNPQSWELGWLALLLRDLAEGELVVGFGGAKGYGALKAENFIWKIGFIQPIDIPEQPFTSGDPSGIYQQVTCTAPDGGWLPDDLREKADAWRKQFVSEARNFQHTDNLPAYAGQEYQAHWARIQKLYDGE